MAQRKAAAKAKQALNGVQKKGNSESPKKTLRSKAIKEDELETIASPTNKKGAAKSPVKSKVPPKKQVEQEPSDDSEVEEDEADVPEENSGEEEEDSEAESANGLIEKEAEESDDDEEDQDTEPGEVPVGEAASGDDSDNDEDDNEDDDDDEAPEEAAISKNDLIKPSEAAKSDKKRGVPNIATGKIPVDIPNTQIIFVGNLPEKYKLIDLIEALIEFGTIKIIDRIRTKSNRNAALVAFVTEEAAEAANAKGSVTMNGLTLQLSQSRQNKDDPKERDARTIVISCIGPNATVEQLKEHFEQCGDVEEATLSKNKLCPYGFVRFSLAESVPAALLLTNGKLNERTITVRAKTQTVEKNAEFTIVLANTSNAESYSSEAIAKIFKKCGEIGDLEVLCTRTTLAFITFKTSEGADKAFEMNGSTVNGLELKLERYSTNRTILITNLAMGITEDELSGVFAKTGEIEHIKTYSGRALIKFKTTDAFCKSFLLNEKIVNGKPIFIEPNSKLKHKIMSRPNNHQNNRGHPNKRPFQPGQGQGQGKRPGGPNNSFNNKNNSFDNKNNSFNNKNNKRPGFNAGKRPGQGNAPNNFKRPKTA